MAIKDLVRKELWAKSGNSCAFCGEKLVSSKNGKALNIGEECHIISKSILGPRFENNIADYDSYDNLILLCKNHHTEIDRNVNIYTVEKIKTLKNAHEEKIANAIQLGTNDLSIECSYVEIVSNKCDWMPYDEIENTFYYQKGKNYPLPILEFTMINHNSKIIIIREINLKAKQLSYSISDPMKAAYIIKVAAKYQMEIPLGDEISNQKLHLAISGNTAIKFELKLISKCKSEHYFIRERAALQFTFKLNRGVVIKVNPILLNCRSDKEKRALSYLD